MKITELPHTVAEVRAHFPKEISKAIKRQIQQDSLPQYMFVDDREHRNQGWCSCCRQDSCYLDSQRLEYRQTEYPEHNEEIMCPECGRKVTVKHVWRGIKRLKDKALIYIYGKSVLDPEVLTARAIYVDRYYRDHPTLPQVVQTCYEVDSYYVFIMGVGAVQVRPKGGSKIYWALSEEKGDNCYDILRPDHVGTRWGAYSNMNGSYDIGFQVSIDSVDEATSGTPFQYVWEAVREGYLKVGDMDAFVRLFRYAAKYTSVEKIAKIGLTRILARSFALNESTLSTLNWRGKTYNDIFRCKLSKNDKKFLIENGDMVYTAYLAVWQCIKRSGVDISIQDVVKNKWADKNRFVKVSEYVKIDKALAYIEKQNKRYYSMHNDVDLVTYIDYLQQCQKLHMDMKSKATLFPKNLQQIHENFSKQIVMLRNEVLEKQYNKRRPMLQEKYEFSAGEYIIIVPEHAADLVEEGKKMHNCVGGYMRSFAEGETDIMFIRRAKDPDVVLGTMEVKDGRIVQARAEHNRKLPEDVNDFVELFRMEKLEKKKRARKTA